MLSAGLKLKLITQKHFSAFFIPFFMANKLLSRLAAVCLYTHIHVIALRCFQTFFCIQIIKKTK